MRVSYIPRRNVTITGDLSRARIRVQRVTNRIDDMMEQATSPEVRIALATLRESIISDSRALAK